MSVDREPGWGGERTGPWRSHCEARGRLDCSSPRTRSVALIDSLQCVAFIYLLALHGRSAINQCPELTIKLFPWGMFNEML